MSVMNKLRQKFDFFEMMCSDLSDEEIKNCEKEYETEIKSAKYVMLILHLKNDQDLIQLVLSKKLDNKFQYKKMDKLLIYLAQRGHKIDDKYFAKKYPIYKTYLKIFGWFITDEETCEELSPCAQAA